MNNEEKVISTFKKLKEVIDEELSNSREKSLVVTKIEEGEMWMERYFQKLNKM